jgi:Uma2 family endonuclease
MSEPARKLATYADLEALPASMVGEIIDGALRAQPRPARRHGIVSNALADELTSPFQKGRGGPGGWIFIDEPELHFGMQVVVPDLAGWRRERATFDLDEAKTFIAPDWVCEVLSPSTARFDRGRKSQIYALAGIGHYWILDPTNRTLEALRLCDGGWLQIGSAGSGDRVSLEPFDAIAFPFDDLFPLDPPAPAGDASPAQP